MTDPKPDYGTETPEDFQFSSRTIIFAITVIASLFAIAQFQIQSPAFDAGRSVLLILVLGSVLVYVLMILARGHYRTRENDPESLHVIASCADQFEASTVVSVLADRGVVAKPVGERTSGFQVEAPGDVKVVVRLIDLEKSKKILSEVEALESH